ncbi:MAG: hypothetical protein IKY83_06045 [Proteobacteria bacterium]|nr:hypothetical protein [Pseudomonadota bacterium]
MLTIATANSKFILSGEHFVVEGAPSVVLPASFTTQVSIGEQNEPGITAVCNINCSQSWLEQHRERHEALIAELVNRSAQMLGIDIHGMGLRCLVRSTMPPGQGAGSSSSLSQAIAEAMIRHFITDDVHPNYLRWFGTRLEKQWHGEVSGIDNAAIAYRRIMLYQRDQAPVFIPLSSPLFFVVGTTGPRSEIDPYSVMRNLKQNKPLQYLAYREAMTDNALQLAEALRHGDYLRVGALMNESEEIFEACGIVTRQMKVACETARSNGALGARMTGAGGGGFVIACVPIKHIESVQMSWSHLKSVTVLSFGLEAIR